MARRRKTTKKIKNSFKINNEVAIVILIFAGILSGALIYLKSGVIGQNLSNFLGGVFGIVKFILPIGFIAVAISLIQNKKDYVTAKLIHYAIIMSCVCTILSIYEVAITKSLYMNQTLQNVLEKGYYLGTLNKGGGVIGAFFAFPLIKLLGVPGTIILTIGLAVTFIVFMFGVKPTEIIGNIIERIKERREYSEEEEKENQVRPETKKERKLREQEEKRKQALEVEQLQLKIDEKDNLKSYKNDDSNPLGLNKKMSEDPEYIEGNLFKQEDEKKADNKREVLQLEHAVIVEDEDYEYPPINLLSKNTKKVSKAGARALTDTAAKLQ